MNQIKLNSDSDLSGVDAHSDMEYITCSSGSYVMSTGGGHQQRDNKVSINIPEQFMDQHDLKEAINFLKAVRRSLKATVK